MILLEERLERQKSKESLSISPDRKLRGINDVNKTNRVIKLLQFISTTKSITDLLRKILLCVLLLSLLLVILCFLFELLFNMFVDRFEKSFLVINMAFLFLMMI